MAVWLQDKSVGFTDGTKFARMRDPTLKKECHLLLGGSSDSLEEMTKYRWSLIAPAVLTKWNT